MRTILWSTTHSPTSRYFSTTERMSLLSILFVATLRRENFKYLQSKVGNLLAAHLLSYTPQSGGALDPRQNRRDQNRVSGIMNQFAKHSHGVCLLASLCYDSKDITDMMTSHCLILIVFQMLHNTNNNIILYRPPLSLCF